MISIIRLLPVILLCFLFSCTEEPEQPRELLESSQLPYGGHFPFSDWGDTIRTGVPVPIKGRRLDPDSLAKPRTFPSLRKPVVVPANRNAAIVDPPKRVQIPSTVKVVRPGKDGVPLPRQVPVQSKVLPILLSSPTPALPMTFLDKRSNCNWQVLDVEQGLKSSFVGDVFTDHRDHLWIGSSGGGVSRYDGNNLNHFTKEQGMPGNATDVKLEDRRGHLWFRSEDNKTDTVALVRYDGNSFRLFFEEEGFTRSGIWKMMEDRRGRLWIGTDKGVARFELAEDGISGTFTLYTEKEGLLGRNAWAMAEDDQGFLWIGTRKGLCRFDPAANDGWGSFTQFTVEEGLNSNYIVINSMRNIGQQRIWLETRAGACLFDGSSFTQYNMRERYGYSFIPSRRQAPPRFASGDQLLYDLGNPFLKFPTGKGFSNLYQRPAKEDRFGNWWLRTEGQGIFKLNRKHNFVYIPEIEGLKTNLFTSVYPDTKGNIWLGTYRPGVVCYNPQGKGTFTLYTEKEGLIHNYVQTIFEDKQGSIWIGTRTGVSRYDPAANEAGGTWTNYGEKEGLPWIKTIMEDRQGHLWFGGDGVYRYDPQQKVFTKFLGKENYFVRDIIEDRQGHLWLASYGLYRYDPANSTFTVYTEREGLPSNQVRTIKEDRAGRVWIGTSEGVCYFNGDSFTTLPLKKGWWQYSFQDYGKFNSIVEDTLGRLWISRERAVSVVVPREKPNEQNMITDHFQIFDFDKQDGIKAAPFLGNSAGIDQQNRIWWGGNNGLNVLDVNQFELPTQPPTVNLQNIDLKGQFVDYRQLSDTAYRNTLALGEKLNHRFDSVAAFHNYPLNLTLPHQLNHLTFHFTAIDWADPEAIQYSYKLEGLDQDWSAPSTEPKADYRNIPTGIHTLRVKAIGMAQIWSEPISYTFTILPPWWYTWWAWCIWIGMGISLLYWFYRFQLRRRLAEAEARRLRELDQVKNHLYTNITHEFRTPLTIINGVAGQLQSQASESVKRGLNMISRNGRQLLRLVNQLLDLAKLESGSLPVHLVQGDIIPYLRYLTESFHSYAESKNIGLHFLSDLEEYVMDYDREKMLHIVSNLLSNAIKFTPSNGNIYLRLVEVAKNNAAYLEIRVQDSGIGIATERIPHVFDRFYQVDSSATRPGEGTGIGLALTRELVQLLGGTIEVHSKLGEGSTFTVLLPATKGISTNAAPAALEEFRLEIEAFGKEDPVVLGAAPGTLQEDSGRPLLLIIEDNADVVRYLTTCLEASYQLTTAHNGQAGIEKALELVPDIIISDVMMPVQDGFEVCNTLKNDEKTSHIPIVLLTAKADQRSRIAGLKRGADVYLAKPFNQEELLLQLNNLIEQRRKLQERYQNLPPQPEAGEVGTELEDAFLQKIKHLVAENMANNDFDITWLAGKAGMNRVQLFRKIKALTDQSPSVFVRNIRLQKAKHLLLTTRLNVSEIAYEVGFGDPASFSRNFKEKYGKTPMEAREPGG